MLGPSRYLPTAVPASVQTVDVLAANSSGLIIISLRPVFDPHRPESNITNLTRLLPHWLYSSKQYKPMAAVQAEVPHMQASLLINCPSLLGQKPALMQRHFFAGLNGSSCPAVQCLAVA